MHAHGADPEFTSNATVSRDAADDVAEHTELPEPESYSSDDSEGGDVRSSLAAAISHHTRSP
jgi:hypothetical protein